MNIAHQLGAAVVLLSFVLTAGGCSYEANGDAVAASEAAGSGQQLEKVMAGPPTRKTLVLTSTQPARIEAYEQTPLFAKLAGYVGEVRVDIGDVVKQDQPLVALRIPELTDDAQRKQALVAQAEAEVAQAAANVDAVKAAADTAAAKVAEAAAGVSRAEADLQRWTAEFSRIKQLAAGGSVTQKLVDESQSQLDAARAAREAAAAAVQSAEAGAREAKAMIAKAEADHAAAAARREVAKADLAHAQTMLTYATITAPFDGVVTQRWIDTGHFVQPAAGAARPLLVVARTDKVRVFLDIPELEAELVDKGDPVSLDVQALNGAKLSAPVARTSWSLNTANRSLRVEVDVPNENSTLRPGMYAAGTIELERRENALTLPAAAIVRADDAAYCCVVADGKIRRTPVTLGLRSGADVELLSGIDQQATVVLARAESLADGQPVSIITPSL
ncbi:MAG TPA: efflux RND transporter periplasmic adaptor subunit [Lacipirellula sp.]